MGDGAVGNENGRGWANVEGDDWTVFSEEGAQHGLKLKRRAAEQ